MKEGLTGIRFSSIFSLYKYLTKKKKYIIVYYLVRYTKPKKFFAKNLECTPVVKSLFGEYTNRVQSLWVYTLLLTLEQYFIFSTKRMSVYLPY